MAKTYVLGVAGGSGSGKTFFARELYKRLGDKLCSIIYQDNFYIDQSAKFDFDGGSVNFDHPSSIDFPLLAEKLRELKSGSTSEIPIYDFATHSRRKETIHQPMKKVILVDGILILNSIEVRAELDDSIFFDTPEEIRFNRRLQRDVEERGRTPDGVRNQFLKQVKPMHEEFVQPSMKYARWVVKEMGEYHPNLDEVEAYIRNLIARDT